MVDSGLVIVADPAFITQERAELESQLEGALATSVAASLGRGSFGEQAPAANVQSFDSFGQRAPVTAAQRGAARMQPRIAKSVSRYLGELDGHRYSMQVPANSGSKKQVGLAIFEIDGRASAIQAIEYSGTGRAKRVKQVTTTGLDTMGTPRLLIRTRLEYKTTVGSLDRLKARVDAVGATLLNFVQPDALHAETVSADDEVPCGIELAAMGAASLVALRQTAEAVAASAALAAAVALCASSPVDPPALVACAAVPSLTTLENIKVGAALLASAFAVGAGIAYADCLWLHFHPVDTTYTSTGGGGAGGGGRSQCPDIDWYVSYDYGPWIWIGSEPGGFGCDEFET